MQVVEQNSPSKIKLINGRLTFEPNSGDIADAEMNRIVEIVGNEIVSLEN